MGDINDLLPKDKIIDVNGVKLTVKPLRLSHTLELSRVGEIMQTPDKFKSEDIKDAEATLDRCIGEVIPELAGKQLDFQVTVQILGKLLETTEPSDNKELRDRGVKFDTDPKAGENG